MKKTILIAISSAILWSCAGQQKAAPPKGPVLIDVRSPVEYSAGHLRGAYNFPYAEIKDTIRKVVTDRNAWILLYASSGGRASRAKHTLDSLGYQSVEFGEIDSLSKIYPYGE